MTARAEAFGTRAHTGEGKGFDPSNRSKPRLRAEGTDGSGV